MSISPTAKKLLEAFATKANWSMPGNTGDVDRFWDFVIAAYKNGEYEIELDEFMAVLNQAQPIQDSNTNRKQRELAAKMFMYNKYEDGVRLLNKFKHPGK
jgi:hypothetical protein